MVSSDDLKKGAASDKGLVTVNLEGNPTVLVVDDEDLMREVAAMMIEEEGGTVLSAANGQEALKILQREKGGIHCIFSDFSMPEMNGYDLYLAVQTISPGIPFVMVSGLKLVPEVETLRREGKIEFITKPFHQTELFKAINGALKRSFA